MNKKRLVLTIACISVVLLSFSIFSAVKIEKQKKDYKSKIESLDKEYIEKIDLLTKELCERIDKSFDLNQLYYEESFNDTINYLEESVDKYIYLNSEVSQLNKEYKKLYDDYKVPEHVQMIESLDKIENAYNKILKPTKNNLENIKQSRNIPNELKEMLFNNFCFLLQSNFGQFRHFMTGDLVEGKVVSEKGFLEYRNDLMKKLNISDYYIANYLINAEYKNTKNIESTVSEHYKQQDTFIDNTSSGFSVKSNNSDIMVSVLTEVDNLNYAIYEKEYNDVVEQYTNISRLAKSSISKINKHIKDINDNELKEIINMYITAFDKHYKAYNRALNSLDNYSQEEESIITTMMEDATLALEKANISYDEYKQN